MTFLHLSLDNGSGRAPSLLSGIMSALSVSRQRNTLAKLTDEQLDDIGVTRSEAMREADRSVWDAPHYWKK